MTRVQIEEILCKSLIMPLDVRGLDCRWAINPYLGCGHVCFHCLLTQPNEKHSHSSRTELESAQVKVNAAQVLREELRRSKWSGAALAIGAACDPYQGIEDTYGITRAILRTLLEQRTPCYITTKSALIERDIDLLKELASVTQVRVYFSIPTLDQEVSLKAEPDASPPLERLRAMERLIDAGVPSGLLLAPIIPGVSDSQESIEAVVEAAAERGAGYLAPNLNYLRPGSKEWYLPMLRERYPHLPKGYARLYKGPHPVEDYTERVMEQISEAREKYGLSEEAALIEETSYQMALQF